jgi:hypothetical protein
MVLMMVEPVPVLPLLPTATQSSNEEHEMPVTSTALDGGFWDVQRAPSLFVCTTYGAELSVDPAAMQVAVLGQAMESTFDPLGIDEVIAQSV